MAFATFIYYLGAFVFAIGVPTLMFTIVAIIERPRRRRH